MSATSWTVLALIGYALLLVAIIFGTLKVMTHDSWRELFSLLRKQKPPS
jgi:hypothetical protein